MQSQTTPCTDMHYTLIYIGDDARQGTLAKGNSTLTAMGTKRVQILNGESA